LASSRISLNSPDVIDVAAVIQAFEQINKCEITVFGKVESVHGQDCLTFLVGAQDNTTDLPDHRYLASVKCSLGLYGHRTMESAILWALYQLDWEMAKYEMERTHKTA